MSQSNTDSPAAPVKGKPGRKPKAALLVKQETQYAAMPGQQPALPALQGPEAEAAAFIALIERAARDKDIDVGKMQALLAMKKEILTEQRIAAFNRDFMQARMEMPRIKKDGSVEYPVDKTKPDGPKKKAFDFAKYETIDKELRPIEIKHGFSRSFTTETRAAGGGIIVHCTLLHKDGHSKTASIPVPLDNSGGKNDLQGYGSSFSYGKRYTTTMIWDIVTEGEDDDGNAAFAGAPIDDAQFAALQAVIDAHGIDTAKFCAHMKVESLRAITNKQYPKAMADLKAAAAKRKEAAAKTEKGAPQQ